MDFVAGLPRTSRGFDSIWVIVDRLTKSAHFLPVQSSFSAERLARNYIREVVRLHGVPSLLYQIGVLCSRLAFGGTLRMSWAPGLTLAQPSTRRLMASQSALFRSLRTCYGLVFWSLVVNGTSSCLWRNFHITTTTTLAFRWPCLRPCMVGVVALQWAGSSLQSLGCEVQI